MSTLFIIILLLLIILNYTIIKKTYNANIEGLTQNKTIPKPLIDFNFKEGIDKCDKMLFLINKVMGL
jgi:hypothetical protein